MSLIDAIEDVNKKIEERDGKKPAAVVEEQEPEPTPEPTAEPSDDTPEATPEPTAEPAEEKPDNAAMARMRREKAAAEKRAADAEARAAALAQRQEPPKQQAQQPAADPEPDKATNWEGWLEWRNRQLEATVQNQGKTVEEVKAWKESTEKARRAEEAKNSAIKTLESYETEFAKTAPDYKEVREFAIGTIANSLRVMRPDLQGEEFQKALTHQLLVLAANAEAQGYNPIENLYHQAKTTWGYKPKAAPVEDTPETPPAKSSLKTIADNKKKSASALTAGGKSGVAPMSKDAIKSMKFSDIAALSPEKFREWESASKQFESA